MAIVVHWLDVGGSAVGSESLTATVIFQEGVRYRCLKLLRGGERNEALFTTIEANTRFPRELMGVVAAQLAGCLSGTKMARALIDCYGINAAHQPGDRLIVHSGGGYGPVLSDPQMRSAPTCVTLCGA